MDDNHLSENLAISVSSPADHDDNEQALHDDMSMHPRSPYASTFLQNAFEMSRDPDEVTPATRNRDKQIRSTVPPSTTAPGDIGPTRDRGRPNTTAANQIHARLDQIIYEPPPRFYAHPTPPTHDPVADERTHRPLYDYEYEDYRDSRRKIPKLFEDE
ncbi:hypothetical protein EDB85DRAFT_1893297 [Lactarius pseudohatsudake]|nr:hypothetical protein EDB85DRAFT_1893297 [Lactarius pseudohatsudake]